MSSVPSEKFFTRKLMQWHSVENARSMPWKEEKDPYKVWLSEIILQQTRVNQGLAYYKKFVEKYPTIGQLATAPENQVFKLWEGLGYYSRCRNLLHTARYIHETLNGNFPETYEGILKLKGIGPYTAAAISSFSFNLPRAAVDGNVSRVIARYFLIELPIDSPAGKKVIQEKANELLDQRNPALYNQGLIDLGAIICTPKNPACSDCPLKLHCGAYLHNLVKLLPVKTKKAARTHRHFNYVFFYDGKKTLIKKRQQKDIWQDLFEFPLLEEEMPPGNRQPFKKLAAHFTAKENIIEITEVGSWDQLLTHQVIHARFLKCRVVKLPEIEGTIAVSIKQMNQFAWPRVMQDFFKVL